MQKTQEQQNRAKTSILEPLFHTTSTMSAAVEQTPQPFILRLQQSLVSCSKILTIKKPRTIQSLFSLIFTLSFETLLLIRSTLRGLRLMRGI
ncbi:uncharacterized protein [Spinacia oleracea]|uniref:Uncharacterized protein isoform X2 n=1 Tax=Spinacia oleracea TaxID=3562 RepID=A0ABM3QN20_SPIOL|nr:uncharacterized protein LOC130460938 isoform X2 [Spinacia oleracea]